MKNNSIQIARAVLALFVIAIHILPNTWTSGRIVIRPFLNISVAAFIYLSGYLTKINIDTKKFYKKRTLTVLIPYLIFTVLYSLPNFINASPAQALVILIKNIFTTQGKYHLYYLVVYIQFVLLTPILARIALQKNRLFNALILCIQPFFFLCIYNGVISQSIFALSPYYGMFFPAWIIYYYLGILVGNNIYKPQLSTKSLLLLTALGIALQIFEGFIWLDITNVKDMYFSQIRITALIENIPLLLLITKYIRSNIRTKADKFLTKIGDASFGIYLVHPAFIMMCEKIIVRSNNTFVPLFVLVTACSYVSIYIANKIIPKNILAYAGLLIKE